MKKTSYVCCHYPFANVSFSDHYWSTYAGSVFFCVYFMPLHPWKMWNAKLSFLLSPPQNLLFWLASTEQTGYVASARHTFGYPVHHTKFRNLWLKASSTLCVTPNISLKFSKICSIQLKRKQQQIQKHATIYLRLALHQSRTPEIENHCNCN